MSGKNSKKHGTNKVGKILIPVILLILLGVVTAGIVLTVKQLQQKQEAQRQEIEQSLQEGKEPEQQKKDEDSDSSQETSEKETEEKTTEAEEAEQLVNHIDLSIAKSQAVILMKLSDEEVLVEKEADTRIFPASMTKMMTAMVALENLDSLETIVSVDRQTYDELYLAGASLAGFQPGDDIRAIDMIYGVMLPSGGECCIGLAKSLFGSEEAFVEKMNEKAQELGMTQTHFVTSSGLHDPEHYTTVRDLTILLRYALKNETFRTAYCTADYTTAPLASAPEGLTFHSTMFKYLKDPQINGGQVLGGKTGYTDEAGLCLASLAVVDGEEYILVTAGASPVTGSEHVDDAVMVYNQIQ